VSRRPYADVTHGQEIGHRVLPLSPQQERLWELEARPGADLPSRATCLVDVRGPLDAERLASALRDVVDRHEILRTRFSVQPALTPPLQEVLATGLADVVVEAVDLGGDHGPGLEAIYERLSRAATDGTGPTALAALVTLAEHHHALVLSLPALALDHQALDDLVAAVVAAYGRADSIAEPCQYGDVTAWQHEILDSPESRGEREAWIALARQAREVALPFAPAHPAAVGRGVERAEIAGPEWENLVRAGSGSEVVLLTGWGLVLARLAGLEGIVVAVGCDGRTYEELRGTLGQLGKHLPISLPSRPGQSFAAATRAVDATLADARSRQEYFHPNESALADLGEDGRAAVSFAFHPRPASWTAEAVSFSLARRTAAADEGRISLVVHEQADRFALELSFDEALHERDDMARLLARYRTLVGHALAEPDRRVDDLALVTPDERGQIERLGSGARRPLAGADTIADRFDEVARRWPDRAAVTDRVHTLTYGALDARANSLAHALRGRGVGPEVPVGLLMERSVDFVCGLLAILKAGGSYLPLDPRTPAARLDAQLARVGSPLLLVEEGMRPPLPRFSGSFLDLGRVLAGRRSSSLLSPLLSSPPRLAGRENLAYVLFTSGSTGAPRAVGVTHGNVLDYTTAILAELEIGPEDALHFGMVSTVGADLGNTALFPALLSGGCLHLIAPETREDGGLILGRDLERHAVDVLKIVPSHFEALLATATTPASLLPSRLLVFGGESLTFELVKRIEAAPHTCEIANHYGPTEATVGAAMLRHVSSGAGARSCRTVPIGRPLPRVDLLVLDSRGAPAPLELPGELYIAGPGVARGYVNDPAATAERFVPALDGRRMYRSGDRVRMLGDGAIELLGRLDHQVKIRGVRVELGEVEAALRRDPAIRDAVVLAHAEPDAPLALAAYVVAASDRDLDLDRVRTEVQTHLPDAMVPRVWVQLERLPLTPNGKIDRALLPALRVQARAPARDRTLRTPTQVLLAGIWAQLLRTEVGGARDDFFQLGGHSLLAMPLVARVQEVFAVELPLRVLFRQPGLEEMAEEIDRTRRRGLLDGELPLLRSVPRGGALPLSFGQQRLWFLEQLHPGSRQYNMLLALELRGQLDQAAFRASVQSLVDRHEALRTSFLEVDGEPRQRIEARVEAPVEIVDLSALPADARQAAVDRHVRLELHRQFDLSSAPLLHATLLAFSPGEHVLLIAQHHIVSDGWSSLVLVREFASLYDAALRGETCPLPELAVQYVDFAVWQRAWWEAESSRQLAYWRERLRGAPPSLELPTDRARPEVQTFAGGRCARDLPPGFDRELRAFAHREGATSFMVVLAAFQVLLSRYSGQEDIVVGTPFANRRFHEVENVLGLFLNVVVLRTDLSGNPSFRELLARVRTTAVEAYDHQEVPFEELVRELAPDRDLTRHPLFQVMLVFNEAHASDLDPVALWSGLEVERIPLDEGPAKFELSLVVSERDGDLSVLMEYASDLFDRATVARMLEQLEVLVSAAMRDPEARIQSLPMLTSEEERALARWNDTGADHDLERCVHQLIADQARRTPDAVAVSFEDEQLTFHELDRRANQLARRLRELGVGADAIVGVCMARSLELVVALLGILKAGGAYMPLDPDQPADRLAFMLSEARPPLVLTSAALRGRVPGAAAHVLVVDRDSWSPRGPGQDLGPVVTSPDQLAYVLFTSGSTGKPKGVMSAHRGLVNRLSWAQEEFGLGPGDVLLHKTPLTFDISVWELFWPLMTGARLALAVPGGHQDPEYIQAAIAEQGVTVVHFVPSILNAFLDELHPDRCASLRLLVSSGEALPPALEERWLATMPRVALHNLYGPTEASIEVTAWACSPSRTSTTVPIGRPISNTQVHLVGAGLERVTLGGRGELCIGGVALARGYLRRPGLTAERFVPDPFSAAGARLYRAGDLARHLPDGSIEFLGRMDDQVKVRGHRIELGEVEAALHRHPAVRDAVVVARDDGPSGVTQLVAYLVPGVPAPPALEELRGFLRASLPEAMIPSAYVVVDALPLTSSGKVDRKALLPAASARETMKPGSERVAPRDDVERALTRAWSKALQVDQVGIDDDYFALGGDSLTVLQVRALARADGVQFSVQDLFRHPTVRRLAEAMRLLDERAALAPVSALEAASLSASCSAEIEDSYPASGMQELMVRRYEEDTAHVGIYHLQRRIHLAADQLSLDALRGALELIGARHPALRTYFADEPSGRGLRQIVRRRAGWTLEEEDISHLPLDLQEERVEALLVSDRHTRFAARSAEAPMFRVRWLGRSPRSGELVLSTHHAITDGWSNVQLVKDLLDLYVAGLRRRLPPASPATSNSVKELIALEQASLRSSQDAEFWRDAVRARPAGPPPLGTGGSRTSNGQLRASLPPATVERVAAIGRDLRVSKRAILLGAYIDVLRENLGGAPAVGVVCHGRSERLSDPLGALGLFWNLVPFFSPAVPAAPSARWGAVHRHLLEIEARASHPLSAIQDAAGGEADELFAATFNFTGFPALVPPAAPDVSVPRVLGVRSLDLFHYPLNLAVSAPPAGAAIDLRFEFDPDQLDHVDVARMSARYSAILGGS